ncbi:MAG: FtsW/RodA/SpoVE family cell cycle protein, partial [Bacillota bacterium]|nr:FtsW/RodA/SpoVE family cell cycle protein [Bacillota bacterium]
MRILRRLDYFLLAVVLVIFTIGLATIATATDFEVDRVLTREMKVQIIAFVAGIVAMGVIFVIPYDWFGKLHWIIYGASIFLLLLVYLPGIGVERFSARSWIELGPIDFQTSELTKIGYVLFLSKFMADKKGKVSLWDVLIAIGTALPIIVLLLLQPDLGGAMVFVFITFGILFVSGMKYWHIALGLSTLVAVFPFAYKFLKPHQKVRFEAFLNPDDLSL